jgi:hypothetical protein
MACRSGPPGSAHPVAFFGSRFIFGFARTIRVTAYVELPELRTTDPKGKTGTYVLRLFPEVRPHRDPEDPEGGASVVLPQPPKPPETPNGAAAAPGNDPDC